MVESWNVDVHKKDVYGRNALHCASLIANMQMVLFLTNPQTFAMNVNEPDDSGTTPLHSAANEQHLNLVKYLVEQCAADVYAMNEVST